MLTWAKCLLLLLQLVERFTGWLEEQKLIAEGERREAARTLAAIAAKMKIADNVRAEIAKLSNSSVDDELRKLEPKPAPRKGR